MEGAFQTGQNIQTNVSLFLIKYMFKIGPYCRKGKALHILDREIHHEKLFRNDMGSQKYYIVYHD